MDSRLVDSRLVDTRLLDSQLVDSQLVDSRLVDSRLVDPRLVDTAPPGGWVVSGPTSGKFQVINFFLSCIKCLLTIQSCSLSLSHHFPH